MMTRSGPFRVFHARPGLIQQHVIRYLGQVFDAATIRFALHTGTDNALFASIQNHLCFLLGVGTEPRKVFATDASLKSRDYGCGFADD